MATSQRAVSRRLKNKRYITLIRKSARVATGEYLRISSFRACIHTLYTAFKMPQGKKNGTRFSTAIHNDARWFRWFKRISILVLLHSMEILLFRIIDSLSLLKLLKQYL